MTDSQHEFIHQLYLELSPSMIQFIVRTTGNGDLAQELTQEAFLLACVNIDKVYGHEKPQGWLFKTLGNLLKREWARRSRTPEELTDEFLAVEDQVPLDLFLPKELSETARKIILLRVEEGRSFDEIAEKVGMTPAACRQQMSRAKRQCKKIWEN